MVLSVVLAGRWYGVRLSTQGIAQSKKRDAQSKERCSEQEERGREKRRSPAAQDRVFKNFFFSAATASPGDLRRQFLPTTAARPPPPGFRRKGQVRIGGKRGEQSSLKAEQKTSMCHFHRSTSVGGQGPGNGYLGSFLLTAT